MAVMCGGTGTTSRIVCTYLACVLQPPRDPQSAATQRSNNAYRVDAAMNFGKQPPQDDVACTLHKQQFTRAHGIYAMMAVTLKALGGCLRVRIFLH